MADVFLSYKRQERTKVAALAAALETLGFQVWFDTELTTGDAYPRVINEQLRTAKAIVVCWSKEAADSDWVQGEAHKAHARGVYVSVKLEDCEPPVPFNAFQDADLATWAGAFDHEGFKSLALKLSKLAERPIEKRYLELLTKEKTAIGETITAGGADEDVADEEELTPVASPYLRQWLEASRATGAREVSSSLVQVAFEEEILRDPRTRWLVSAGPLPTHCVSAQATLVATLKEAVQRADAGDCIVVFPGTYRGRTNIQKDIRVVGFGTKDNRPVLTGDGQVATLVIDGNARVENLVLDSRDDGSALRINAGAPLIVRCLIERRQLAKDARGCVHIQGQANPAFLACTIWSQDCPSMYFAAGANGSVLVSDIVSNDAEAVVVQSRARPTFKRSVIRANAGHAVVSNPDACGTFEGCSLHASGEDTIVNLRGAFSKFIANRITVTGASLIELQDAARGVFERNRIEPDGSMQLLAEEQARERKKLVQNKKLLERKVSPPIQAALTHRARFSQNRFPDGSLADPPLH